MIREYEGKDGIMLIDGIAATEIAEEFGTPVYVTEEKRIRENYRRIHGAFSKYMDTRVNYACKANTNLSVLRILEQEGSCIDAVSLGEVLSCIKAGFSPDRILYTGVNVSNEELRGLVDVGCMINVDSESELERLAKISTDVRVSFRITPGVASGHGAKVMTGGKGSKFGIPIKRTIPVYTRARDLGFDIRGIHAHTGSGGEGIDQFTDVTEVLSGLANDIRDKVGIDLEFIDIGGGVGVPYRLQEEETDVEELASLVTEIIQDETEVKTVVIEPGRYIVADSTVLLTRCVDVKDAETKRYIGVDAGFNTLVRPAFYDSYHTVAMANKFNRACSDKYDVVGPICESGDYLAHDRVMPEPEEGDLVAIFTAGAYGFSMSSEYNSRPRCAEVLVSDGKACLIRRAEDTEDLWRNQIIPEGLRQ